MAVQSPLLRESRGGLNVLYNGKFLYSEYNPAGGAERTASAAVRSLPFRKDTLYVIPSPLLWYGLDTVLSSIPKENLIAIEYNSELYTIAEESNPGITLVNGNTFNASKVTQLDGWPFRRIEFMPLNGGYREQQKLYDNFRTHTVSVIQEYWQNRLTMQHLLPLWIRNIFKNLSLNAGYYPLSKLHTDKPVLVAGAGESLEVISSIDLSNLFVLAIDTALPYFLKQKIRPDAVLAVDGQFYNFLDFIGIGVNRDIPLIMDATLYPGISRLFTGRKYLFMTEFWKSALTERLGLLIPDKFGAFGSVGIAGIETALQITPGLVYTAGLDFCYSLGKTHAKGTTYSDWTLRNLNRLLPYPRIAEQLEMPRERVTAVNGDIKYSDRRLLSYADLIRRRGYPKERLHPLMGPAVDLGYSAVRIDFPNHVQPVNSGGHDSCGHSEDMDFQPFLQKEHAILSSLYESGFRLLSSGEGIEDFRKYFQQCDYPALHIPDMDYKRPHPTQLKRMLLTVQLYMTTIAGSERVQDTFS